MKKKAVLTSDRPCCAHPTLADMPNLSCLGVLMHGQLTKYSSVHLTRQQPDSHAMQSLWQGHFQFAGAVQILECFSWARSSSVALGHTSCMVSFLSNHAGQTHMRQLMLARWSERKIVGALLWWDLCLSSLTWQASQNQLISPLIPALLGAALVSSFF